jgi:hypothetical protein
VLKETADLRVFNISLQVFFASAKFKSIEGSIQENQLATDHVYFGSAISLTMSRALKM